MRLADRDETPRRRGRWWLALDEGRRWLAARNESPKGAPEDSDLDDARESLRYWEVRARRLPRRAVRRRREARAMAVRWRAQVQEAERRRYGGGAIGAVIQVMAERRLPEGARHTGHQVARVAIAVTAVFALAVTALVVALVVAAVSLVT